MTENDTAAQEEGLTPEKMFAAAAQVTDWDMSSPDKVEILKLNDGEAVVRLLDGRGEVESRVINP